MKGITLESVATCLGSDLQKEEYRKTEKNEPLKGVVIDSRLIEENFVFIATKGERVDGHNFIPQVAKAGAALVICEKEPEVDIPYILVKNSFIALKQLASFYREQLEIPIIGISGSVGKTSTKEIVASALSYHYHVHKTEGNFNNEVGLPLTLLKIREEHEVAVVEMGISDFGEMSRLTQIAKPNIAVLTNIGDCHLEQLGDRDGVLKAKLEILEGLHENGTLILNGDDEKLGKLQAESVKKVLRFGHDPSFDVSVTEVHSHGLVGSDYSVKAFGHDYEGNIGLPGVHMVMNAMAAICVAQALGMTVEDAIKGIHKSKAVDGRSNIIFTKRTTIIDDCYNANPNSMQSALKLLEMAIGNKTAILGDMFELGEEEVELHQKLGKFAAQSQINRLICIGNLAKHIYESAIEEKTDVNILYFETKEEFIEKYGMENFVWDTILIKASHGMAFEELVHQLVNHHEN